MKWSCGSFLENRTFDQRLVKGNLVDKWNIHGDIYKARTDYRQFQDSYVIHQNNTILHVIGEEPKNRAKSCYLIVNDSYSSNRH